jgi:hypothetical protein
LTSVKEMLLRHLQTVVRGFNTVDHVLRRGEIGLRPSRQSEPLDSLPAGFDARLDRTSLPARKVAAIVFIFGPIYGAAMGAYAWVVGERTFVEQLPQMIYSGVKVPILIALTVAIALPSFFVINTLLGLRADFREALRAIVSAQAGMAVILVSLFPLTLFSYVSMAAAEDSYALAILFNAAMFGLASVSAQVLLRGYYEKLIERSRRHQWMVRMWIFVYAFVGIQAGYVLRPFIGDPSAPPTFLRKESFQNAYVKIFELVCNALQ